MVKIEKNCEACGDIIHVKLSDHKRGYGRFCDKSCAAAYKCGQRPKDVNKNHAKYSLWAKDRFDYFMETYGGIVLPKAKPIKEQLGKNIKITKKKRNYHKPIIGCCAYCMKRDVPVQKYIVYDDEIRYVCFDCNWRMEYDPGDDF